MKNYKSLKLIILLILVSIFALFMLTGCGANNSEESNTQDLKDTQTASGSKNIQVANQNSNSQETTTVNNVSGAIYSTTDLFTERDLTQTADLSQATKYTLSDGNDIHITQEGVYVISGSANNATIYVEAGDEDKVQIVLDGVSITNIDFPCIYCKTADKVFITTTGDNTLVVSSSFKTDGDIKTDGTIFAKTDITLNGTGTLTIKSTDNGIVGKDDVKVTGGTYNITATSKAIEANDSIRIADGTFDLSCGTDGLHAENDDDESLGYIYIGGGNFTIKAGDDGIHGTTVVQIDGGELTISAAEGIEGTYIQINDGTINIEATDDGINAANKSSAYSATLEVNGGNIKVTMGPGDTDGIDSNGNIYINGGTIDVTGNSTFDYDGKAEFNGGTIIVNGTQVDTIPNQMMGGGRGGNFKNRR